jgi:RNA polymerase sigma-70 factor (ECF subfamily)
MNLKANNVKELFEDYSDDILNYSLSLLKNYDDAKDAVQEVFIRFIKSQDSFRGECSYKTWLLTITRNYCFGKMNGKGRQPERIDDNFIKIYEPDIDGIISLKDALDKLNEEDTELIYLREYAGHSYREIAEILDISVDNVKVKLFRVREHLRKYLKRGKS